MKRHLAVKLLSACLSIFALMSAAQAQEQNLDKYAGKFNLTTAVAGVCFQSLDIRSDSLGLLLQLSQRGQLPIPELKNDWQLKTAPPIRIFNKSEASEGTAHEVTILENKIMQVESELIGEITPENLPKIYIISIEKTDEGVELTSGTDNCKYTKAE